MPTLVCFRRFEIAVDWNEGRIKYQIWTKVPKDQEHGGTVLSRSITVVNYPVSEITENTTKNIVYDELETDFFLISRIIILKNHGSRLLMKLRFTRTKRPFHISPEKN